MTKPVQLVISIFAALVLGLLTLLSARGIFDPRAAALSFGVPLGGPVGELYHQVYRSRNLALGMTGMVFLFTGMWRALAILATTAIALPVYDIVLLRSAHVPIAFVHPVTLAALVVLAALLWFRVRSSC